MEQKNCSRVIAIALNGGSKSKHIVNWAYEKFNAHESVLFKLIHVYSKITGVPTPMGNLIPLSKVREDVVTAYKKEIEWQKHEMILPYQKMLTSKKVLAEVVLLESDEIWSAISKEIAEGAIKDLVIGASSNSLFARKIRGQLLSSMISETAPSFCTVYVVLKGKLESLRPSDSDQTRKTTSVDYNSSASHSAFTSSRYTDTSSVSGSTSSESSFASLPSRQSPECNSFKSACADDVNDSLSSGLKSAVSLNSISENEDWLTDQASISSTHSIASIEDQQKDIKSEVEKLRMELRHIRGMYSMAQDETMDTTRKLIDLNRLRIEEGVKLKQIQAKEEIAKKLAKLEKEKFEAAKREAEYARDCALKEARQRREAEKKGAWDAKEKQMLKNELAGPVDRYQTFTWEEIVSATCSFSDRLKIGEGSYGTVYKCQLHHTSVAIKVLHSEQCPKSVKLLRELDVLSKVRHPHLLLLLGACTEHGCLVYEYMENGSLEDRLFRKNDTPAIPWYARFRIIWEVASALAFLHSNKPKPIIHHDLKLANILLDNNFVSKISDAGLCTMLNSEQIHENSAKADIYALGVVILQLLTAKPDVGITQFVESAIKERRLVSVLDKDAGRWPSRETTELALLGVKCAEIRSQDRHDVLHKILPMLERLQDIAEKARDYNAGVLLAPPSHFICPILQNVMEDPCVASDGYTYDRKAIELWVKDNDTSPTTNFPLANKQLIPNYSLLYAIMEWKSKRKLRTEKSKNYSCFSFSN